MLSNKATLLGITLPNNISDDVFGFVGPYLMHYKYGAWLSQSFINLKPIITPIEEEKTNDKTNDI